MPGRYLIDAFAVDNLDSPRILSDKASSLVQIEKKGTFIEIPYQYGGEVNFSPAIVAVTIGYNNTVTWLNNDNGPREIAADRDGSDFAAAAKNAGAIPADGTFTYTFAKPGRCGYHGNGLHGTVLVLPDPYEGYEKVRDSRFTSMDLEVYGSYDPSLAGHFVKGHIYDGNGRRLADSNISISAEEFVHMGNATSDVDGFFDFQSLKAEPLSHEREAALRQGRNLMDLNISAYYAGDNNHLWSEATKQTLMYLAWPPIAPGLYDTSTGASSYNNSTGRSTIRQGGSAEVQLTVKPVLKQYEVDGMMLEIQRLPWGVSATVSGQDDVTMDHTGNFHFAIDAKDYAKPGDYFIMVRQDISMVKNPYAHDLDIAGFWLEILPK